MKDLQIRSLYELSFDKLSDVFLSAFSDYEMVLDRKKLKSIFHRRGADTALSFGAYDGSSLVSFIINGIGKFRGVATAYDTGTGTVAEYRGRGLTDRIFKYAAKQLCEVGIKQYLLEVLQHNIPAMKIYKRQGFEITREFHCYHINDGDLKAKTSKGIKIVKESVDSILPMLRFMDFEPSWQNGIESVLRVPDAFNVLVAYQDEMPVGYGVTESAYGDVAQLAVDPSYRGCGIATGLLVEMLKLSDTHQLRIVNVDASDKGFNAMLTSLGFTLNCSQYEMIRSF